MATLMVGRCIEFRIMPFSFAESNEYCKQLGKEQSAEELFIDYIYLSKKQRYSAVRKTLSNEQYSVFCTQILAEW